MKVQQELNVSVPVRTQVSVFNLAGSLVKTLVAQPGNTTIDMIYEIEFFSRFTSKNMRKTFIYIVKISDKSCKCK